MARPTKSVNVISKHLTAEELATRKATEQALRGSADKIKPPKNLTSNQKKIFKYIVAELKESNILSNLDVPILVTCSRAIDRLNYIEDMINDDPSLLMDNSLMSSKDKYTKDLYRCCNELCLSPQARAKMGSINLNNQKESEDPLLKVLAGGSNG